MLDHQFLVPPCELTKNGGCEQNCTNKGTEAVCSCTPVDYKLGVDGKSCEKVHPCNKPDKGGCSDKCTKDGGNAKCACDRGRELTGDGKTCEYSEYLFFSF